MTTTKTKPKPKTKTKTKTTTTIKTKPKKQNKNNPPNTIIHQYVTKKIGGAKRKIGVIIGRIDPWNEVRIGWSRVNINAGDEFDKARGYEIALARTNAVKSIPYPPSFVEEMSKFQARIKRYFKNAKLYQSISVQKWVRRIK